MPRTAEQIREQYELERRLASRLRDAAKEERRHLYSEVYDELLTSIPHHPMLTRKAVPEEKRKLGQLLTIVSRYLGPASVFLEVGAGDCALSREVAKNVRQVYAVDVSRVISEGELPENCNLILSDGTSIPVPEPVSVAMSNQLMEHLHPDDAQEQLENIYSALERGGRYVCITPNRLTGPHDISVHFDNEATGFHLKEYTYSELVALFRRVGFRKMRALAGGKGIYISLPSWLMIIVERAGMYLPKSILNRRPLNKIYRGIILIGTK